MCVCLCVPAAHASSTFPCEPAKETEPHEEAVASFPKAGSLGSGLPFITSTRPPLSPIIKSKAVKCPRYGGLRVCHCHQTAPCQSHSDVKDSKWVTDGATR